MRIVPRVAALVAAALVGLAHAQLTTYHNAGAGYRIDHPLSWSVVTGGDGVRQVEIELDADAGVAIFADPLTADDEAFFAGLSPEAWVDLFTTSLRGEMMDFVPLTSGPVTVGGRPAVRLDFTGTSGRTQEASRGLMVALVANGSVYVIVFKVDRAREGELLPLYDELLATFALIETGDPSAWRAFEDAEAGFRLEVPARWQLDEAPGLPRAIVKGSLSVIDRGGARVQETTFPDVGSVAFYGGDRVVVTVHTYFGVDAPEGSLDDLVRVAIDAMGAELGGFEVTDQGAWSVGGQPAAYVAFTGIDPYDEAPVFATTFLVRSERWLHSLTFEAPPDSADEVWAELDAVFDSVAFATAAPEDGWVGSFSDGRLTLALELGPAGYVGALTLEGRSFGATAQPRGDDLDGVFVSDAQHFAFTASRSGDTVILVSGGADYTLERQGP